MNVDLMEKAIKKKIIIIGVLIFSLFFFLMNIEFSAADITGMSMNFLKTSININQNDRNWVNFKVNNYYGESIYYTYIKSSGGIAGLDILIDPSVIEEYVPGEIDAVVIFSTNQSVVNGSHRIRIWAEGRDSAWNKIISPDYYVNVTIFSDYTPPTTTTSTSSTTTSSSTTTTESPFSDLNKTFSGTLGKNISKNQILIIVAVVMILLVVIPMFSFKKGERELITYKSKKIDEEEVKMGTKIITERIKPEKEEVKPEEKKEEPKEEVKTEKKVDDKEK